MSAKRRQGVQPSRVRTQWQLARNGALAAKGYTKVDVWRSLAERGHHVALSTVMSVIANRFNDPEVRKEFCRMTGTREADMWPAEEPTYRGPTT